MFCEGLLTPHPRWTEGLHPAWQGIEASCERRPDGRPRGSVGRPATTAFSVFSFQKSQQHKTPANNVSGSEAPSGSSNRVNGAALVRSAAHVGTRSDDLSTAYSLLRAVLWSERRRQELDCNAIDISVSRSSGLFVVITESSGRVLVSRPRTSPALANHVTNYLDSG